MSHPLISAIRLRTLPLAAGAILMGTAEALRCDAFDTGVLVLTLTTAFLLQILSNLANDYGDFMHGADSAARTDRALASGKISIKKMKGYMLVNALLALTTGILLLLYANSKQPIHIGWMLGLGLGCILGALFYTAGKRPYGYAGFGDLSVFIFFGPVAVLGSAYLHTGLVPLHALWPALVFGLLSVAVLNVNNLRDIESDKAAGKNTVAVRINFNNAKVYQTALILTSCLGIIGAFGTTTFAPRLLLFAVPAVLLGKHLTQIKAIQATEREAFNQQLKQLSLTNLLIALIYLINQL